MDLPKQFGPFEVSEGTICLPAFMPVPGMGLLAANTFLIDDAEPMVVDTGIAPLAPQFMASLASAVSLQKVRWIWLTHMDPDHLGALPDLLKAAPRARIVTNFLGAGKLGLLGLPTDRIHMLSIGDVHSTGRRKLTAVRPPTYDAPETMGLWEDRTGALFSADSFAAILGRPASEASDLSIDDLLAGAIQWAEIDTPWLGEMDSARFNDAIKSFAELGPQTILSSHLPPARGIAADLLANLSLTQRKLARLNETPGRKAA